ncbi:MAG TPA: hypothetical protein VJT73_18445, partial [Polyangiaceae bacterium]|nr:hypothetical protein [Polyangiaceae bacterium]
EFKVGDGAITGEAAYYQYTEDYTYPTTAVPVKSAFYVLGSYLTGPVGPGRLQPLVRFQSLPDPGWNIVDVNLTYVVKGYDFRVALNYQRTKTASPDANNALQLGVQLQK